MPLIDVHVMEGIFPDAEKAEMIRSVTRGFGDVAGQAMAGGTSIRIHEVPAGSWGYGGEVFTLEQARAIKAKG